MDSVFETFLQELKQIRGDSSEGLVMLVLICIVIVLIVGLIIYGLLDLINYVFLPIENGYGKIIEMRFEEAHYTTTQHYNHTTKMFTPHTVWHPNAWKYVIEVDGKTADHYVSAEEYIKHKIGDRLSLTFKKGRIWKNLFIGTVRI